MSHFFINVPSNDEDHQVGECEHCGKIAALATTEVLGGFYGQEQEICNDCCREWGYCWSCGIYTTEADGGLDTTGPYCQECNPNT